jgi:hypothetical protein
MNYPRQPSVASTPRVCYTSEAVYEALLVPKLVVLSAQFTLTLLFVLHTCVENLLLTCVISIV